ncbi:MAG: glycosyltransferase family 87 protein, partial [Stellaceae bacterium]
PYAYPPSYLLALWPVGMLPYAPGSAVFIATTLTLYLWATVGRAWRSPALAAALVLPTTTIAVVSGQGGFLTAALLAGGLRLAGRRPILSGVLLGLLTYKPQLGLLVPVALVSARLWRTLGAAAATALVLAFLTSLLFGWRIWPDWLTALPAYSRQFAAESSGLLHLMPTVFASLLRLGAAPEWARLAQGAVTLAVAATTWTAFRAGPSEPAKALLLAASFLATPYAFVYDLPMLATAIIWLIADRQRCGKGFASTEVLALAVAALFPIAMPGGLSRLPSAPIVLAAFVAMIVVHLRRRQQSAVPVASLPLAMPQ